MPHERAYSQHCVGIQQMGPCGSNIESPDLSALVCRSNREAIRTKAAIVDYKCRPCTRSLLVKRIRRLEPRTGQSQVQVERIGRRELKIHAIKYIFFISLGMHHGELRRIKKATAVQSIYGDEVSQFVTSVSQIKANVGSAETTVRGSQ